MWIRNIGKNQLGRSLLESDVGQACNYLKVPWLAIDWWHQPVIFITCTHPPTPTITSISSLTITFYRSSSLSPVPQFPQSFSPTETSDSLSLPPFPSCPHLPPPCLKPLGCHYPHALHTPERPLLPSGGTPNGWHQLSPAVQCGWRTTHYHVDWSHFTYLTDRPNGPSVHCSSLGPFLLPRQFLPVFSSNLHHLLSHLSLSWGSCFLFHRENSSNQKILPQASIYKYSAPSHGPILCIVPIILCLLPLASSLFPIYWIILINIKIG